jgi:putative ABC transport system substrate-binding protein
MRRREFIGAIGSAAFWPLTASAESVGKLPVIGILWNGASAEKVALARQPLLQGLAELGYIRGKNILLEERFYNGMVERFDALATELVSLKVDVLVTGPGPAVLAVKRATSAVPIVFVAISDPHCVPTGFESCPARRKYNRAFKHGRRFCDKANPAHKGLRHISCCIAV